MNEEGSVGRKRSEVILLRERHKVLKKLSVNAEEVGLSHWKP